MQQFNRYITTVTGVCRPIDGGDRVAAEPMTQQESTDSGAFAVVLFTQCYASVARHKRQCTYLSAAIAASLRHRQKTVC